MSTVRSTHRSALALGIAGLALAHCTAHAEIYTFNAVGTIAIFNPDFDGADQFPFAGLEGTETVEFTFHYDTDQAPDSIEDGMATYTFTGNGSSIRLGDSTASFLSFTALVWDSDMGDGLLIFRGFNPDLGLTAQIELNASSSTALPTSLDPAAADTGFHYANSDLNQLLLPILQGGVETATITPAPGGVFLLIGAGCPLLRRRRIH